MGIAPEASSAVSETEVSPSERDSNTAAAEENAASGSERDAAARVVGSSAGVVVGSSDVAIASQREEDILGILTVVDLPARMPLQMEAAVPVYLRPRDALTGLHRLLGGARSTSA
jgi:hypothetical protein